MPADPNIVGGYIWVVAPGEETFTCGCGGLVEHLCVKPTRSRMYTTDILMCNKCKRILA